MRILIVGAGATGGYFGARLLAAGRDVTFLVRPRRRAQLAEHGLVVKSPHGDIVLKHVPTIEAGQDAVPFDLVLLSCKAYDLDNAVDSFAPFMGPASLVLPVLNGMKHLDVLDARFGSARVLGGCCLISSTLDENGTIIQLAPAHTLSFGERPGGRSARVDAVAAALGDAGYDAVPSEHMHLDMWEKWVMLCTLAASTCSMRAQIGEILSAPGGRDFLLELFSQCCAVATAAGYEPRAAFVERSKTMFTTVGSPLSASMLRDIEKGAAVEADHIVGDLLARGSELGLAEPLGSGLARAYLHLKAYEARRAKRPS